MNSESQPSQQTTRVKANAILAEVDAQPTIVNVAKASRKLAALSDTLAKVSLRIGCLSSFTFDPLKPFLELQGLRAGMAIEAYVAPYGQIEQQLIDASSDLAAFRPDVVLLAVRLQDVCPALYEAFNALTADAATQSEPARPRAGSSVSEPARPRAGSSALVDDWITRLRSALLTFRQHLTARVLIQNYDMPAFPAAGIADPRSPVSQCATITRANEALTELAGSIENAHVMDYEGLVSRHGRRDWQDPRTALFARIPIAPEHYWHLAGFYVRHIRPLYGLSKKVLVLDADNTLWGGVVGDVGLDGIALGHDYPGNAFVAFQKRVLELYHRGVILCLASKNEPGAVEEVFDKHPDMVLRAEHFAATRINWDPKPQNIRQMAADLNLGIDSFVFVDDSAVECELMRTALPDVLSVTLPSDPARLPGVIESLDCFDQWTISAEDRKRGRLYRSQVERSELQAATVDMPTFYRQLEMRMTVFVDHAAHVARASQMTNRTNQFNMHTIRCSEDDIRRFMEADDHHVVTLVLKDRFGDNGVVGLAVVRMARTEWVLHMFLMSCRVLGRTVEQTFVGWLAEQARKAGAKRLSAEFLPTAKNKPFVGFYQERGFTAAEADGDARQWVWDLTDAETAPPDWIDVIAASPDDAS